jgi:hypothetical protein
MPPAVFPQMTTHLAPPDSLSPSELHQLMGESKAQALARARRVAQVAMPTGGVDLTNYDVGFYDISIRVDDTTEVLYGRVRLMADITFRGVEEVAVCFFDNMLVDSIVSPAGELSYTREGNAVTITLDRLYDFGEQVDFDFWYHGHPIEGGLQSFSFDITGDGDISISSLSEPYFAASWWPCKDVMADKADSFKIHIEVDTSLYVASNGSLDSVTSESSNTHAYHYSVRYPMATYLFSLAISPFTVWQQEYVYNDGADTMPIVHHVYPGEYTTSLSTWGQSPGIMQVLVDNFGEYPFLDEKYGHANFEWAGGMEHQTVTSMWGNWFGFHQPVIIHEMAHQWWGDMITCESWSDIWLNEGWASYAEAIYYLDTEGWNSYHSYMKGMEYYGNGTIYVYDTNSVSQIFHGGLSYDKGAWVVHMLRGVLGEQLFATAVAAWYDSEFKFKAATTEDFKNVVEAATGEELDWFFEDWIFGSKFPRYQYFYMHEQSDSGGYDIYLAVKQVQVTMPLAFGMPVDFLFDYSVIPDDTLVLKVDQRRNLFRFNKPATVDEIILDPSNWILDSSWASPWSMFIITLDSDLAVGQQYRSYEDTLEYRGGTGNNSFTITGGALPDGFSIDNDGIISGLTTDTGLFTFTVRLEDQGSAYVDEVELSIRINPDTCCVDVVGNADCSQDQVVDIGDVTACITNLFISLDEFCCKGEADVDFSDVVDVGDLTLIITSLFISLDPFPACQ